MMEKFYTRIGEHLIQIISGSVHTMNWVQRNFPFILDQQNDTPDILIHVEEGYGDPFTNYEVDIKRGTNQITFRRTDYIIDVDPEYKNAKISAYNELALKHALMNLYSSYIVYHHWGLVIHSSCVVEGSKAHIFAGHSGAGKSTAAKLSFPREILSDEATLVKVTPEEISVFNSPFRSELEVTNVNASSQLASIQILYQSPDNKRTHLRRSDGLLHVMDKVFYWAHNPEETGKILDLLKILVNTVPIYELHFQKNDTFWELIS